MQIDPKTEIIKLNKYPEYENTSEYLIYRKLWNTVPKSGIVTEYPMHIDVEVSRVCSLKCPFCARKVLTPDNLKGYFDFELYKKTFKNGSPKAIKFNWLGEPLHHPKLSQFIKLAKHNGVLETLINTNGMLLTKSKASEIIESGLDRIIFSIDTINSKKYRKMRVGGRLEYVVANIQQLITFKDGFDTYHPIIRVQKIDFEDTREEPFKEFWENIGVDEVSFISYKQKDKTKTDYKPKPCAQPFQRLLIDVEGNMHLCCGDYEDQYIVGNLKENSVYNAWHSDKAKALRKLSKEDRLNEIKLCQNCEVTK